MRTPMVVALTLALTVAGGAWWLTRSQSPDAPSDPPPAREYVHPVDPPAAPPPAAAPATPPGPAVDVPFRERLRDFLAGAAELSPAEREREAEALRRDALAREADGALLPAESAYVQLALLRVTVDDEALLRQQSEALLDRYESASEQGWEAYRRRSDPRHEAYRQAEAALVSRAREEGLSNAELRERLQALREDHYTP